MQNSELDRGFGFVLHDVARLLRKRFDQRAKCLGLTRAQWQALAHLQRHEGINQSGLAEILELEPISLARLIDRMEEAGWVERRRDPADRRAHRLFMTPRARRVADRMGKLCEDVRAEAFAGLDQAERDALVTQLLHIRGNLSEHRARPEPEAAEVLETCA
jgi:DNA-binding MarR family transcriptional regulator